MKKIAKEIADRNLLMNSDIPIRQSIIVTEFHYCEEVEERGTTHNRVRTNSNYQSSILKKTDTQMSFEIPDNRDFSKFLVNKLRRLTYSKMKIIMRKIQEHHHQKITLSLLTLKKNNLLRQSLNQIFSFAEKKSQITATQTLKSIQRPHQILSLINKSIRRLKNQSFQNIMKKSLHFHKGVNLLKTIEKINQGTFKKNNLKKAWNSFIAFSASRILKESSIMSIKASINQIQKHLEQKSMKKIVKAVQSKETARVEMKKKQVTQLLNIFSVKKVDSLFKVKEELRQTKNQLERVSSLRNQAKIQSKRNLNAFKVKIKEEIKKLLKEIQQLEKKKNKYESDMKFLEIQYSSMSNKMENSKGKQSEVFSLYEKLLSLEFDSNGIINKKKFPNFMTTSLDKYDSFHLFKNQKMKQQIFHYESKRTFSERMIPHAEKSALEENQSLKGIISAILCRQIQNYCYRDIIEKIGTEYES